MLIGAMAGIVFGTLTFRYINADGLRLILGLISLLFGMRSFYNFLKHHSKAGKQPPRWLGVVYGSMAGFTSFIAHSGAPPVQMYLLPMRMDKTLFHATTVLFFAVVNYVKLIPYFWLGEINSESLFDSLLLLPFIPVGFYLGVWLHKKIRDYYFYLVSYISLLVLGAKLVFDGATGLLG